MQKLPHSRAQSFSAQAPLVVRRLPSGWSAPEALAQHREDQEGLEVGADLAVFSKDLCLRLALGWMDGWEAQYVGWGNHGFQQFFLEPQANEWGYMRA